jgi:hypothetical protein
VSAALLQDVAEVGLAWLAMVLAASLLDFGRSRFAEPELTLETHLLRRAWVGLLAYGFCVRTGWLVAR